MIVVDDVPIEFKDKYCYNSQSTLRGIEARVHLDENRITEFTKCYNDIIYFAENYVKVNNLDGGIVDFVPYDFQKEFLQGMVDERFVISMQARQMGKTICVAVYILWKICFTTDWSCGCLAQDASQSQEILSRVKLSYEWLPWWLKPSVVRWNEKSIKFDTNTLVFSSSASPKALRGKSLNLLFCDEFAFVDKPDEFYRAVYPITSSSKTAQVIMTSTPNGMNYFYKMWSEAISNKNGYKAFFYPWSRHPHRDEGWYETTLKNTTTKQFAIEFSCEFHGSSDTLILGSKIQALTSSEPYYENNELKQFILPEEESKYILACDVAEGLGADYSVIQIIDITKSPYQQVGIWRSNIVSPIVFVDIINDFSKAYNDATILLETNNNSSIAEVLVKDLENDNVITTRTKKYKTNAIAYDTNSFGIKLTAQIKARGCSKLKSLIETDTFTIHDDKTIDELSTFIKTGSTYKAEQTKNDDTISALILFAWYTTQDMFHNGDSEELRSDMVDRDESNIVKSRLTCLFDEEFMAKCESHRIEENATSNNSIGAIDSNLPIY